MNLSDRLIQQMFNRNGLHFVDSGLRPDNPPTVVAVPFPGGVNFCSNVNPTVHQHMDWVSTPPTTTATVNYHTDYCDRTVPGVGWAGPPASFPSSSFASSVPAALSQFAPCNPARPLHPLPNTLGSVVPGTAPATAVATARTGPRPMMLPMRMENDAREGLRMISPCDLERIRLTREAADIDADPEFNDILYMSLQGDLLPFGANHLDDYLNRNRDARLRMYLDAVVGNQGCPCECEKTPLDRYLAAHRDVNCAITLRATLSEERIRRVREPMNTKNISDQMQVVNGQVRQALLKIQEMSGAVVDQSTNSWDAINEDQGMLIG